MTTSLKQLTMYARDYIDLIAPSLMSRQANNVKLTKEILDVTALYKNVADFDYETAEFYLNLDTDVKELVKLEDDSEDEVSVELSDEEKEKLQLSKQLDDIYRKFETSSYTKQITLKFGRIAFSGKQVPDAFSDDDDSDKGGLKDVEQHLFSVPISIVIKDSAGKRHYSIVIDDSLIKTDTSFLRKYMKQEYRDELFKFIATHETGDTASIPLAFDYIDELWAKTKQYLLYSEAENIVEEPDMENVVISLAPKVNHFLSQDLLGIIEAAEDDALLETSLSAWVSETDMSISEPSDDTGSNELFFPFPYDQSQLHVLGKINNKAAVVEGPPGTGKSQTISNILAHLAATNKKVLFVSQKDQAVRGVKDKLKSLDIPFLYGYIPDRSSKLHSDEDDKDSASHVLKGLSQSYAQVTNDSNPIENLISLNTYKPEFDMAIDKEREFFNIYEEWLTLDTYEFNENSVKISSEWFAKLKEKNTELEANRILVEKLQSELETTKHEYETTDILRTDQKQRYKDVSASFAEKNAYSWTANESLLLRNHSFSQMAEVMSSLMETFDQNAFDRKANFISSKINDMKLGQKLDQVLSSLPQEIYTSIKAIVFSNESKSIRYEQLKNIMTYFEAKAKVEKDTVTLTNKLKVLKDKLSELTTSSSEASKQTNYLRKVVDQLSIDDLSMERVVKLAENEGQKAFDLIAKRYQLSNQLEDFHNNKPNSVHSQIIKEKKKYKSNVNAYIRNRLIANTSQYRQSMRYRAALESIGKKLGKSKKAYKTFDLLKSDPFNFEAMSGVIPIWMMGLDDASRILPLQANIFDYVIIDEASQCNISYALPAMFRAKHTIFFGDTLQMRDTTTAFKSNEQLSALAKKHSIPEDLQIKADEDSVKSVMDIAKLAGFETSVLRNHYRSPIELIGFSNENFYKPRGRSLQVINDEILAMDDGRVLKNHIINSDPSKEISDKTNLSEAYYIHQLIQKIKSDPKTKDKSIAVLTFFNEQAELIRRIVTDESVKVATIEGIQGDEKDIVIYSFVIRSPEEKRRYIALTGEGGEVRKEINEGRVNVAFSRAKLQVHAVTSLAPNLWPEGIWIKKYLEYVEKYGRVNRLAKSEQHFDSHFEDMVYETLISKLDVAKYTLTTQVESCGFKIDLVVRNIQTGKKLALESDGPSHFEDGNGQVRVSSDYERQYVLETAGWEFYRISYIDWQRDRKQAEKDLISFTEDYFKDKPVETIDNSYKPSASVEYTVTDVEVPDDLLENMKTALANKPKAAFGRKTVTKEKTTVDDSKKEQVTLNLEDYPENAYLNPAPEKTSIVKETPSSPQSAGFDEITSAVLSSARSIVISRKDDGDIWVNDKLTTDKYSGFTSKGFGIKSSELNEFVEAYANAINSDEFSKSFVINDTLSLVVYNPDPTTVDVRLYKKSDEYTGFMKKGLRLVKTNASVLLDSLRSIR